MRLLDRSVQYAENVDNRWIRSFALTESLWIRARSGEPQEALRGFHTVIDTWFRGGDWANQWLSLRYVFAIFETLEHNEVAATLHGALENAGAMRALPMGPGTTEELSRAVDRLTKRLGPSEFAEAAERGRAMRDEEVVRYALAAITAATKPESRTGVRTPPIWVRSHAGSTTRASSVWSASGTGTGAWSASWPRAGR